jgi:outer membrane immunogenic protein
MGIVMMNRTFTAFVGFAASVLPVAAADLGPLPMAPAPTYNWTGIYVGLNGGGGWGQQDPYNIITDRFDGFSQNISGGLFGGTVGAQAQAAHVVLSLEADFDWADISGSGTTSPAILGSPLGATFDFSTKMKWIGTARARAGYANDNWLYYVTFGAALVDAHTNISTVNGFLCGTINEPVCNGDKKKVGGVIGAGIEYGITQNLSAKLEYEYMAAASLELAHVNMIKAGLNYRFGF